MARIILDREKDAPLLSGFQLVTSEVEFLRVAATFLDLHIQGEPLCSWAETYYRNRGINCQEVFSVTKEMERSFADLTADQITKLLSLIGENLQKIERPLTAEKILNTIFPAALWSAQHSSSHMAEWLVWVYENCPSGETRVLMRLLTGRWAEEIENNILAIYRGCLEGEKAEEALENWLGITNREIFPLLDEFPLAIPNKLVQKARDKWNLSIVASHGKFFEQLEPLAIPFELKKLGAKETYQYYLQNSGDLIPQQLSLLARYLSYKEINELRKRLPPKPPSNIPETPELIAQWYLSEFLPYREWQESYSVNDAREHIIRSAKQFSYWYLDNYPKALTGGPLLKWLSFYRTAHFERNNNVFTLIIVLDGMHSSDARTLIQNIRTHTTRLSMIAEDVVFSPIPTITQFAKEALFRGVPPDKTASVDPIGIILPEDKSPAQRLTNPDIGKVYFWRVLEPDRTYHHKNKSENLLQDVAGRLEAEALKIKELVETISDQILMQIIITTDHGRLLGNSKKTLSVPDGMQSHGRVAWGKSGLSFPGEGWFEQDNIVYLYGERFGLSEDMAIPIGEESFLGNDDRSGCEAYPHGGLFPEEVIVPWYVFARDVIRPKVEISISGEGRARGSGTLQFKVLNLGDVDLILDEVVLYYRNGSEKRISLKSKLASRHDSVIEYRIDPWPSTIEASGIRGIAKIVQPNSLSFDYSTVINIQSKDIYDRGENILEDLF
jgi:hypothetical protein